MFRISVECRVCDSFSVTHLLQQSNVVGIIWWRGAVHLYASKVTNMARDTHIYISLTTLLQHGYPLLPNLRITQNLEIDMQALPNKDSRSAEIVHYSTYVHTHRGLTILPATPRTSLCSIRKVRCGVKNSMADCIVAQWLEVHVCELYGSSEGLYS
jgi:hypothetical protein